MEFLNAVFDILLWLIQIATAAVILVYTFISMRTPHSSESQKGTSEGEQQPQQ